MGLKFERSKGVRGAKWIYACGSLSLNTYDSLCRLSSKKERMFAYSMHMQLRS